MAQLLSTRFFGGLVICVGLVVTQSLRPQDALAKDAPANQLITNATTDRDEAFSEPDRADDGYQGLTFRDAPVWSKTFSWLQVNREPCTVLSGNCGYWQKSGITPNGQFHALLSVCASQSQFNCIESVTAIKPDGVRVAGQFVESFPQTWVNDFDGDTSAHLPQGGPAGIWSFSGIQHSGGTNFFIRVGLEGRLFSDGPSLKVDSSSLNMHGAIYSVEKIAAYCPEPPDNDEEPQRYICGPRFTPFAERIKGTPMGAVAISAYSGKWSRGPSDCVMTGFNSCLQRLALPAATSFSLTLRLEYSPSGWLHGRFRDARFSIEKLEGSGFRMTVEGTSVSVPVIAVGDKFVNLPSNIQDSYRSSGGFKSSQRFTRDAGCGQCSDPLTRNMTSAPLPDGLDSLEEFEIWRTYVGDKSTADLNSWSFRTLDTSSVRGAAQCFTADGTVKGLVAVNSLVYSPGPPEFKNGMLEYVVSAPHLTSGGSTRRGTYDLIIRSDTARCIYGFSKAPLQAIISVLDADGDKVVATTNMSESGGWIRLVAYGFEFSAPRIQVSFTQDDTKTKTASPTPKSRVTSPRPGQLCTKRGESRIVSRVKLRCVRSGTLLIWRVTR